MVVHTFKLQMATDIANQKVGKFSLVDGAIITASKVASEELLSMVPFVGNGTLRSGAMKSVGAVVLSMVSNQKYVQYVSSGLLIDGVEDLIAYAKGLKFGSSNGSNDGELTL